MIKKLKNANNKIELFLVLSFLWGVKMNNQTINCTVESCEYNNYNNKMCELKQIEVKACQNCQTGSPEEESMCGSYKCKCD